MANLNAFSYDTNTAPSDYRCSVCDLHGVKLWRPYASSRVTLKCAACSGVTADLDDNDQVGWGVPAVPYEDGASWWGYTSIPCAGAEWWHRLPCVVRVLPKRQAMTAAEARKADADADAADAKAKRDAATNAHLDALTATTLFAVKATDFETMTLWSQWHKHEVWTETGAGYRVVVGKLGNDSVRITVNFACINGAVVAFYDAVGEVSDTRLIEAWITKHMPVARRIDAMRFAPPHACNSRPNH